MIFIEVSFEPRGLSSRSRKRVMEPSHKSGPLKQSNKSHKHGRHKSKGEISATHKGRVGIKISTKNRSRELRKADRKNQQKQLRANKRQEVLSAKRQLGTIGQPPHLLVIIPLSEEVDLDHIHSLLCGACDLDGPVETTPPPTLLSPLLKQRFTLAYPSPQQLYTLLDVAKVADTLLLVHRAGVQDCPAVSTMLDCLMAQGLPTVLHVVQGLSALRGKAVTTAKKTIQKKIEARFHSHKVLSMDSFQHAKVVLRTVSTHKRSHVTCRDQHAHLLVDRQHFTPQGAEGERGTLLLSGYVRSKTLSVNSLLHIPGLGDFQMSQVDSPRDPCPFQSGMAGGMAVDGKGEGMEEDCKVLEVVDPAKQVSLESEAPLDPMAGEQTWPSEQELREAEDARKDKQVAKRVPKGTSEYQAAWILESDSEQEEGGSDVEDMEEGVEQTAEGEWPFNEEESSEEEEEYEDLCTASSHVASVADCEDYDADMDVDAEKLQLQRLRSERDHLQFPDEVDTPNDVLAKVRFQKYRGLKSFRTSPWNPLENLPRDYARIFQFENYASTKKRVLRQKDEGAMPGWYVTLHVSNVPSNYAEKISSPLVVYGLLPYENKTSVLHYVLRRTGNYTLPIKSKDELVFHTGVRRFTTRPIFSQHSSGDKHKFERFFQTGGCSVASVYGPISYPPQPVLVFHHQQLQDGGERSVLVATGSLHRVQPQRVVCKRIVLSGHPYKINKRSAVIRYMFFNREDIQWFKPVELRTKFGGRGHIKEPLGTHGHMKCVFDRQLKAQDTVLMYLYKRVYPKWGWSHAVSSCPITHEETMEN